MSLGEGKRSGAVFRSDLRSALRTLPGIVLLFLCAPSVGGAAGGKVNHGWKIVRKDPSTGEVELEFTGSGKVEEFSLAEESRTRAVLSHVLTGGTRAERRVIVRPIADRGSIPSSATIRARIGNEFSSFRVDFPVRAGYRLFAVPPFRGTSLRLVRKTAFELGGERECVFAGGVARRPDPLIRHGLFADPVPDTAELSPGEGTAAFPAELSVGGKTFFAWTVFSAAGKNEVWITSSDGRPRRLSESGRFPQLAAAGERIYCVWRLQDAAFLCVSRDAGKSWDEPRLIARSSGLSYLSAAARGESVLILWQDSGGVSWRISRDGGANFSLGGELNGA